MTDAAGAVIARIRFTSPGNITGGPFIAGYEFTVGSNNITVDQLGYYDQDKDGLVSSHDVGIFDVNTQNLLASTSVNTTHTLDGFFRYSALSTPLTLQAGQTYRIAGTNGSDLITLNTIGFTVNPAIQYNGGLPTGGSPFGPLSYPNQSVSSVNNGFFGPNFSIASTSAAVPFEFQPSMGLLLIGLGWGANKLNKNRQVKLNLKDS
jgi:hypothetical protein